MNSGGGKDSNSRKSQRCGEGYQEIRRIWEESEVHNAMAIAGVTIKRDKGNNGES